MRRTSQGGVGALAGALVIAAAVTAPGSSTGLPDDGATSVAARSDAVRSVAAKGDAKPCKVGKKARRKGASRVIVVRGEGTRARVTACKRTRDGYVRAFGPIRGWVGRNGIAPQGAKREGDGRTPSGTFRLGRGFGVQADPGLRHHSWRQVDGRDVWVDDPRSALYNKRARLPARGRWASAERLKVSPAYDYAQVIAYNKKRRPYRGSAIFLHVGQGRPTAGCVAVPRKKLLRLLRFQRPGSYISIRRAKAGSEPATAAVSGTERAVTTSVGKRKPFRFTTRKARKKDLRHSWRPGCPVPPRKLRVARVRHVGFDGEPRIGTLVVHRDVVKDLRKVFRQLYAQRFPIRRMRPIDVYGGNDDRSLAANNTSAFNCRKAVAAGAPSWSKHAYGRAVDINPVQNPYLFAGRVLPPRGRNHLDRSRPRKGMVRAGDKVVRAFARVGWRWGGVWRSPDYQHFDRP